MALAMEELTVEESAMVAVAVVLAVVVVTAVAIVDGCDCCLL